MSKKIYFFPITVQPLEEGGFLAKCETLQGCHAEGATYGQAIENVQDVIQIQIEARKKYGDILPTVSIPQDTDLCLSLPLPICA